MDDPLATIEARLAAMPLERRHQLLRRAGVDPACISAAEAVPGPGAANEGSRWGFPTNLPPRHRLIDYLQRQQQAAAAEAAPPQQQQPGPAGKQPSPAGQQPAQPAQQQQQQQQQQRPLLLELLEQSRTFQSPDCAEAMAELFGAADMHRSLRGSLLRDVASEQAVAEARTALRAALKSAWSHEALRRGVALAKAGDLQGALPCYDQALQMDPSNADALVARGAALANRQQWQRASDDLEAALELQAQHSNAQQYLEAVQSKAAQSGVTLLPLAASRAAQEAAAAAAANGGEASPPGQQREQRQDERERGDAAEARPPPAGQRHQQGERRRSRHESVERRKRGRDSSRSRSRGRRRRRRSGGSGSRSSSSGESSGGSDSEAAATAAQLAAAAAAGEGGDGMDVATALQIVSSHYKSRRSKKEGHHRGRRKSKKDKKEKRRHGRKRRRH